jgi:hypothetical protein
VHLRAIKLRGFKSFPDPVEVRLEQGVAVVVGPNGSGKSNVSDALRWAALESGLPPEDALELASGATGATGQPGPTGATGPGPPDETGSGGPTGATGALAAAAGAGSARRHLLVQTLADQAVGRGVRLEQETAAIIDRVAAERGWEIERGVQLDRTGGYQKVDFVLTAPTGRIFIETAVSPTPGFLLNKAQVLAGALTHLEHLAAFVVVPDKTAHIQPPPGVEVVEIGDLERKLRDLEPA